MSANKQMDKAQAVAIKVAETVESTLLPLDLVMRQWPPEFRVIMWNAIAHAATIRATESAS